MIVGGLGFGAFGLGLGREATKGQLIDHLPTLLPRIGINSPSFDHTPVTSISTEV
jgi:hypothetical protein